MGLDMYIFKVNRGEKPTWDFHEIAYWRKANAIHKFFVEKVQGGVDDCEIHDEITKEILTDLMNRCDRILNEVKLIPSSIPNGYHFVSGQMEPIYEDGYTIDDDSICKELLPSTSGFFFGNTAYSQYYYEVIKDTYSICKSLLKTTDFETEALYYASSW